MANQTNSSTLDPAQERKSANAGARSIDPWARYDHTPQSRPARPPSDLPAWFETDQYLQHLAQGADARNVQGEIPLHTSVRQQGEIIFERQPAPFGSLMQPPLPNRASLLSPFGNLQGAEAGEFGQPPVRRDFLRPFSRPAEPPKPLIPPEEIARRGVRDAQKEAGVRESLRSLITGAVSTIFQEPGRVRDTALQQLFPWTRQQSGIQDAVEAPSRQERADSRRASLTNALSLGEPASTRAAQLLEQRIGQARDERITSEQARARASLDEEAQKAARAKLQEEESDGNPLEQTGAKSTKNPLTMLGAYSRKAARFGKRLASRGVGLVKQALLQRWLGKDHAGGSTRIG